MVNKYNCNIHGYSNAQVPLVSIETVTPLAASGHSTPITCLEEATPGFSLERMRGGDHYMDILSKAWESDAFIHLICAISNSPW